MIINSFDKVMQPWDEMVQTQLEILMKMDQLLENLEESDPLLTKTHHQTEMLLSSERDKERAKRLEELKANWKKNRWEEETGHGSNTPQSQQSVSDEEKVSLKVSELDSESKRTPRLPPPSLPPSPRPPSSQPPLGPPQPLRFKVKSGEKISLWKQSTLKEKFHSTNAVEGGQGNINNPTSSHPLSSSLTLLLQPPSPQPPDPPPPLPKVEARCGGVLKLVGLTLVPTAISSESRVPPLPLLPEFDKKNGRTDVIMTMKYKRNDVGRSAPLKEVRGILILGYYKNGLKNINWAKLGVLDSYTLDWEINRLNEKYSQIHKISIPTRRDFTTLLFRLPLSNSSHSTCFSTFAPIVSTTLVSVFSKLVSKTLGLIERILSFKTTIHPRPPSLYRSTTGAEPEQLNNSGNSTRIETTSKGVKKNAYSQKLRKLLDYCTQYPISIVDDDGSNQLQNLSHNFQGDAVQQLIVDSYITVLLFKAANFLDLNAPHLIIVQEYVNHSFPLIKFYFLEKRVSSAVKKSTPKVDVMKMLKILSGAAIKETSFSMAEETTIDAPEQNQEVEVDSGVFGEAEVPVDDLQKMGNLGRDEKISVTEPTPVIYESARPSTRGKKEPSRSTFKVIESTPAIDESSRRSTQDRKELSQSSIKDVPLSSRKGAKYGPRPVVIATRGRSPSSGIKAADITSFEDAKSNPVKMELTKPRSTPKSIVTSYPKEIEAPLEPSRTQDLEQFIADTEASTQIEKGDEGEVVNKQEVDTLEVSTGDDELEGLRMEKNDRNRHNVTNAGKEVELDVALSTGNDVCEIPVQGKFDGEGGSVGDDKKYETDPVVATSSNVFDSATVELGDIVITQHATKEGIHQKSLKEKFKGIFVYFLEPLMVYLHDGFLLVYLSFSLLHVNRNTSVTCSFLHLEDKVKVWVPGIDKPYGLLDYGKMARKPKV